MIYIDIGISRGKDITNITGMEDIGPPSPVSKRKRKSRKLTNLDTDEDSDESEEYQASEYVLNFSWKEKVTIL